VGESSAQAPHLGRQGGPFDRPARHVEFVNALVANVAIAEIPKPMPVVMDQIAVVRLRRSRAEPQVEREVAGRRLGRFVSDAPTRLAAIALGDAQLAVLARLHGGNLVGATRTAPLLRAVLHPAAIFPRGFDGPTAFRNVMT